MSKAPNVRAPMQSELTEGDIKTRAGRSILRTKVTALMMKPDDGTSVRETDISIANTRLTAREMTTTKDKTR